MLTQFGYRKMQSKKKKLMMKKENATVNIICYNIIYNNDNIGTHKILQSRLWSKIW